MVITMARREANNALSEAFMAEITAAFDQAEADPAVKAVVLTGSDRVFCMGADIEEMLPLTGAEALLRDADALADAVRAAAEPSETAEK